MTLADAHLHLFRGGYQGERGMPPAGEDEITVYEGLRAHHGIEAGLVVGYEGMPRYVGNNDDILTWSRSRSWLAPLCYLHVDAPPDPGVVGELLDLGYAGFSLYLPDAAAGSALASWPPRVLRVLGDRNAILSLNARPPATALLRAAVTRLAPATVLFSHLGLPVRVDAVLDHHAAARRLAALLALADLEHVVVKLSGFYSVCTAAEVGDPYPFLRPLVQVLLDRFGPFRLTWGSDFSPALDFVSFAATMNVRALTVLDAPERNAVMGGNLLRLLASRLPCRA